MSEARDRSYYSSRAEQENELGEQAADPAVAAIHFELADRYSLLAEGIPTLRPELRAARG